MQKTYSTRFLFRKACLGSRSGQDNYLVPLCFARYSSTTLMQIARRRTELLEQIYGSAFAGLRPHSPEWINLFRSGKIWSDHFRPHRKSPYMLAQRHLQDHLSCIDEQKTLLHQDGPALHKRLVDLLTARYAHQSMALGENQLLLEDALIIEEHLERTDCLSLKSLSDLCAKPLPSPYSLLPQRPASEVAELRNMVLLTRHVANHAISTPSSAAICHRDFELLARILLADTRHSHQPEHAEYRTHGTWLEHDPIRIFPEAVEVPALVMEFAHWQLAVNGLHPLIQATQACAYFLHIHPFQDCNGRIARLLMLDHLLRKGYLPVVFHDVEAEEYLQLVSRAQDGQIKGFCRALVRTQHDLLLDLMA